MKATLMIVFVLSSLLVVMGILGCQEKSESVPDTEVGLSKASVFDSPAPDSTLTNQTDTGDQPVTPREFFDQPPVIPHGIADFIPITFADNQCIDCHGIEEKVQGEPTPIPPSHHVDMRNSPGATGDEVVGARYNCVSCHVSPGGNKPLVENDFK
jgi:nitrate reductase cytochrome c-type subunit